MAEQKIVCSVVIEKFVSLTTTSRLRRLADKGCPYLKIIVKLTSSSKISEKMGEKCKIASSVALKKIKTSIKTKFENIMNISNHVIYIKLK